MQTDTIVFYDLIGSMYRGSNPDISHEVVAFADDENGDPTLDKLVLKDITGEGGSEDESGEYTVNAIEFLREVAAAHGTGGATMDWPDEPVPPAPAPYVHAADAAPTGLAVSSPAAAVVATNAAADTASPADAQSGRTPITNATVVDLTAHPVFAQVARTLRLASYGDNSSTTIVGSAATMHSFLESALDLDLGGELGDVYEALQTIEEICELPARERLTRIMHTLRIAAAASSLASASLPELAALFNRKFQPHKAASIYAPGWQPWAPPPRRQDGERPCSTPHCPCSARIASPFCSAACQLGGQPCRERYHLPANGTTGAAVGSAPAAPAAAGEPRCEPCGAPVAAVAPQPAQPAAPARYSVQRRSPSPHPPSASTAPVAGGAATIDDSSSGSSDDGSDDSDDDDSDEGSASDGHAPSSAPTPAAAPTAAPAAAATSGPSTHATAAPPAAPAAPAAPARAAAALPAAPAAAARPAPAAAPPRRSQPSDGGSLLPSSASELSSSGSDSESSDSKDDRLPKRQPRPSANGGGQGRTPSPRARPPAPTPGAPRASRA